MTHQRYRQTIREITSNLITYLKNYYTYYQLSHVTDLPITVLNRYAKGSIIPNYERSVEIYEKLKPLLAKHIRHLINDEYWDDLYFPSILNVLSTIITFEVAGHRVTKILAFNDMSPLAIATSLKIGAPFVIITQVREMRYKSWDVVDIKVGDIHLYYHIPRIALKKRDGILYIDTYITPIREDVLAKMEEKLGITIDKKIILKNLIDEWERNQIRVNWLC